MERYLIEVHRIADARLWCSESLLPNGNFQLVQYYRVRGVAQVIEGETTTTDRTWVFFANPTNYPPDHADIYGEPLDDATVEAQARSFILTKCHRYEQLSIERY